MDEYEVDGLIAQLRADIDELNDALSALNDQHREVCRTLNRLVAANRVITR